MVQVVISRINFVSVTVIRLGTSTRVLLPIRESWDCFRATTVTLVVRCIKNRPSLGQETLGRSTIKISSHRQRVSVVMSFFCIDPDSSGPSSRFFRSFRHIRTSRLDLSEFTPLTGTEPSRNFSVKGDERHLAGVPAHWLHALPHRCLLTCTITTKWVLGRNHNKR